MKLTIFFDGDRARTGKRSNSPHETGDVHGICCWFRYPRH